MDKCNSHDAAQRRWKSRETPATTPPAKATSANACEDPACTAASSSTASVGASSSTASKNADSALFMGWLLAMGGGLLEMGGVSTAGFWRGLKRGVLGETASRSKKWRWRRCSHVVSSSGCASALGSKSTEREMVLSLGPAHAAERASDDVPRTTCCTSCALTLLISWSAARSWRSSVAAATTAAMETAWMSASSKTNCQTSLQTSFWTSSSGCASPAAALGAKPAVGLWKWFLEMAFEPVPPKMHNVPSYAALATLWRQGASTWTRSHETPSSDVQTSLSVSKPAHSPPYKTSCLATETSTWPRRANQGAPSQRSRQHEPSEETQTSRQKVLPSEPPAR
mmetsp:Transcript_29286/g.100995  ORF Transcript_29286/g.100995 Transcript_29286/m.100995 type:complete len:340 (-) Transcript_29286:628-1647(-)